MVPALTDGGRSFKGAALYYLHDKRRAGEAERLTTDRVAWTQAVNLPTDNPEIAWRMMATTAMKADELKAAAGIKATGRKLTKPALAYSLAWHPDEAPTKAEQIEAAQETLKRLGLTEHQALIVCHNDEPHPHVHVIVNRVHPTEGKAATLSKSKLILSQWAQEYEERRGKILCPKRAENNAKRQQGEHVRDTRTPRPAFEFNRAADDGARAAFTRTEQKEKDAQIAQAGRDMHESHARQWAEIKRIYRAGKGRIYEESRTRQRDREDEVKAAFKPQWAALFAKQRGDRRAFEDREESPLGKLWNMAQTARELRRSGITASFLAMAWGVLSKAERMTAFERAQEGERRALARVVSREMREVRGDVRRETKAETSRLLTSYLKQCGEIRQQQGRERAALKLAWASRNTERKAAYAALRDRAGQWQRLQQIGERTRLAQTQGRGMHRARSLGRD